MKNLVKRFGQFVNENHHDSMFSPNAGDDNMLPNRNRYDRYEEEGGYDDEGNDLETCDCNTFDDNGDCVECGEPEGMERQMDRTMYNRGEEYQRSKIDRQIDRHNMGRMDNMSASELSEAKKQEKIEALDAIDKKFAKMKPAKKSMPMKPMTKKNMEEEEEESSMKPKMLFGKPVKSAKPETNKMPLKGGKPAFLSGKKKMTINEGASQVMSLVTQAMSGTAEPSDLEKMKSCIINGKYTHLLVLNTGAGAFALGSLCCLFASGIGTIPALILTAAGAVIITADGLLTSNAGPAGIGSVAQELDGLYKCFSAKA